MKKSVMRHSIKIQFALTLICLMTFFICLYWIINTVFLEKYYTGSRQRALVETYYDINSLFGENEDLTDEQKVAFNKLCGISNLSVAVVTPSLTPIITSEGKDDMMVLRLLDHVFGYDEESFLRNDGYGRDGNEVSENEPPRDEGDKRFEDKKDSEKVIIKNDDFELMTSEDPRMQIEYLELWGSLDNGDFIIMRTTVASIRESVRVSNRFLGYIGIVMALLAGIIGWIITTKITKPILELVEISEKMSQLDFNAKYTGGGNNEIAELGYHMNELSEALEENISELKTANNELKRDIEKKEKLNTMRLEFLSNVAHELKTPIALIQGYAEGLRDNINDDEESRNFYCDVIIDESGKMNKMVKNLMTLNQLEFGEDEIKMERFDIVELIRNVMSSSDIMLKQNNIAAFFNESESVYVWADEFKTEEVFTNYFSNAIHYCDFPKNGTEEEKTEKRIDVTLERKGDIVRVSVFNSGNPIPEESLAHLWEKFYKVDKARTHEYGGSGIGLSIVKAIMNAFNKDFGVKNYDNGVAFWFELDSKGE